ncbi:MAG: tRNA dihydrouridine synthase DusB [Bacteroidales bacterium]
MVNIGKICLEKFPLFLAPMENLTDSAFRRICKAMGADVVYTEFVSSDGLIRNTEKFQKKISIFEDERPVGIQIFGGNIDSMKMAAEIAEKEEPDLIDINFGCPVKKIVLKGAGAGIFTDIKKMLELTKVVVNSTKLPVTVKTRLGWDDKSKCIVEIAEQLQDAGIKAITIHGRTRMQMYKGNADWTLIGEVKNNPRMKIPVIGNGDVDTPQKAKEMFDRYGVDGIMLGRAAIGNPWIFDEIKHYLKTSEILPAPDLKKRIQVCKEHLRNSIECKGEKTGILEMRPHYSGYFKAIENFKPYKLKLMSKNSYDELLEVFSEIEEGFC